MPNDNRPVSLHMRVPGLVLLAFAIAYGIAAAQIEYSFSSDPWGPRAFPLFLAGCLALLSLRYIARPGLSDERPVGALFVRILTLLALCFFGAALYPTLGFPLATFLMCAGIARLFRATIAQSLTTGVANAAVWYALFTWIFEVPLPLGSIFGF